MTVERYRSIHFDNARWDGFRFRPGDIVITSPPKSGTTWMQTLCALLIFGGSKLPEPLPDLSPWLEHQIYPVDTVIARLDSQRHRRFIKSHTPLDGIPIEPDVTYVCMGRDPRDAFLSLCNHLDNMNLEVVGRLTAAAMSPDEFAALGGDGPPEDPEGRFRWWVDNDNPPTESVGTLRYTLHHLGCSWRAAGGSVVLFHYNDLRTDLAGEMRRLAEVLGIEVPDSRWPALVEAASFKAMTARATELVVDSSANLWHDPARFFNRGTSGQWRTAWSEEDLRRYDERVAKLVDADLAAWMHNGRRLALGA